MWADDDCFVGKYEEVTQPGYAQLWRHIYNNHMNYQDCISYVCMYVARCEPGCPQHRVTTNKYWATNPLAIHTTE